MGGRQIFLVKSVWEFFFSRGLKDGPQHFGNKAKQSPAEELVV
jgi:hypothetical protein